MKSNNTFKQILQCFELYAQYNHASVETTKISAGWTMGAEELIVVCIVFN